VSERTRAADPVRYLDDYLGRFAPAVPPGLPRFFGGAVGWLSYDVVRSFERLPGVKPDDLGVPELCFAITDTVVIFDNLRGTLKVVAAAEVGDGVEAGRAYDDACARIDAILERLARPTPALRPLLPQLETPPPAPRSTVPRETYEAGVRRIQEYILAGDAFQVVYSQRFEVPRGDVDPFDVYRALRVTNPSPYMFHLEFPEAIVTGASPETLVRLEAGDVYVRPIAGTRKRGSTPEDDAALEAELRADPKERAEHVMLIDLGRNDVGRVSEPGSVRVDEVMTVERYSHVMHLVSNVRGRAAAGTRPGDVVRASFPAGTLSGAPKIRAMEIIEELEPARRGIYGGAVGYVSYTGNLDLAIAIRTLVTKGDTIHVQAGAGIVADSRPEAEHAECVSKARAVVSAVEIARRGRGTNG
jgi:anthranilate synthase component 1